MTALAQNIQLHFAEALKSFLSGFIRALLGFGWIALALFAVQFAASRAGATPVEIFLKPEIIIEDATVTLGDLFVDIETGADHVIAKAPAPGDRMSLRTDYVQARARKVGYYWSNARGLLRVDVRRRSQTVSGDLVISALRDQLASRAPRGEFEIFLSQPNLILHAPIGEAANATIANLSYDTVSGRFSAKARAGETGAWVPVTGKASAVMTVPVLARSIARGETITSADLTALRVPAAQVAPNAITHEDDVIGLAAMRRLGPNSVLRVSDLKRPAIIEKGALVTMIYKAPGLKLTMRGRALADAGLGEAVMVVNGQSHRSLQAMVVSPGVVEVASAFDVASASLY